jgi:hypothetical protein
MGALSAPRRLAASALRPRPATHLRRLPRASRLARRRSLRLPEHQPRPGPQGSAPGPSRSRRSRPRRTCAARLEHPRGEAPLTAPPRASAPARTAGLRAGALALEAISPRPGPQSPAAAEGPRARGDLADPAGRGGPRGGLGSSCAGRARRSPTATEGRLGLRARRLSCPTATGGRLGLRARRLSCPTATGGRLGLRARRISCPTATGGRQGDGPLTRGGSRPRSTT